MQIQKMNETFVSPRVLFLVMSESGLCLAHSLNVASMRAGKRNRRTFIINSKKTEAKREKKNSHLFSSQFESESQKKCITLVYENRNK